MYRLRNKTAQKTEAVTFSSLGMQEHDIEEILNGNIGMICDEEESMLIVGRQVKNEKQSRSDLTAVDNEGNLVLIEIKRDRQDIVGRREAFEFQAIRYAAGYATIVDPDQLVKKVYVPYLERYGDQFAVGELTSYEFAARKLNEFLQENEAEKNFNAKQRIILVASGFDEETLSAVAWLNSNGVDISCYKLTPYKIGEELYLRTEKILPLANYEDYYVNIWERPRGLRAGKGKITRRSLPKIDSLLKWGVVQAGDTLLAKGRAERGILLANGNIEADGQEKSLQVWLQEVFGWASVATYSFTVHQKTGKTLSQIRSEYMQQKEAKM